MSDYRVDGELGRGGMAVVHAGWHEGLEVGVQAPYEGEPEAGQMQEAVDAVALCPPNDIAAVRAALAAGDVAAIILEPTGGHFGTVPVAPGFLQRLRDEATRAAERAGAKVTSSVSKSTDFVVAGDNPGSKYDRAAQLGVEIVDEKEFLRRIGET